MSPGVFPVWAIPQSEATAFTVAPSSISSKSHGYTASSDKLNIAVVGIGSMGITNIKAVYDTENIVALCDVDWKYLKPVLNCFHRAKKYKDFRKMYDEMSKDIDVVMVATPDHTHAIQSAQIRRSCFGRSFFLAIAY